MKVRILDLDGSLLEQQELWRHRPEVVPLRDWGPRIRLACLHGRFAHFERDLSERLAALAHGQTSYPPHQTEPTLTLYGSGDFHHVSLALLRRLRGPFNLLVLDKHPDWMQWLPFLHCGTWVAHALRLPGLHRLFHLGGELDFDNRFRWLAPWRQLLARRVVVFPAVRRFQAGTWRKVPHQPLRPQPQTPITAQRVEQLLAPYQEDLARWPLYVSVDKDVLNADEAIVNWDSGHLHLAEAEAILGVVRDLAGDRLAGMDIVGDWSRVQVQGWFRHFFHWTEHPTLDVDPTEARRRNQHANLALLAVGAREDRVSAPAA